MQKILQTSLYVSGSSKIQTLLPSNVVKIAPQGLKFCNSVEKYQILSGGNNVWILLEPLTYSQCNSLESIKDALCNKFKMFRISQICRAVCK